MKIEYMKINGFGKLKDKDIYLKDKINIIEGNNESGKSTLLKFISSMFYGASKNKNGKEICDFEKYKPWNSEEYSGKIKYKLDNGEEFEIYRDFKKKSPQIYNNKLEEISKNFNIDKNKGNEFFVEQTGISEEIFLSTGIAEQSETKLDETSQNNVIQKLSNLVSTGSENVSLKKVIDRINRKQLEEIGTDRSIGRPLNLINKKIEKLEIEKNEIKQYENEKYQIQTNKSNIENEINQNKQIIDLLRDVKIIKEKNKIDEQIIESKEKDICATKEKINQYRKDINNLNKTNKKEKNYSKLKLINILFLFLIILSFIIVKKPILLIAIPVLLIIDLIIYIKNTKKPLNDNIENEINKLNEFVNEKNKEKERLIEEYKIKQNNQKNLLIEKNNNIIDRDTVLDILSTDYDKIVEIIDEKEREITEYKISEKTIQISNQNVLDKLENLVKIDEELNNLYGEKEQLENLNNIYNIVKNTIEDSYNDVRDNLTPDFIEEIQNILSEVADSKYRNITLDSKNKLIIEIENGNYMPIERLSVGTIDLIYLSLRLSAIKEITNENMPIILDESFAYYDDNRMKNILEYLSKNYDNQILILTCTNREKELLDILKVGYNIIRI